MRNTPLRAAAQDSADHDQAAADVLGAVQAIHRLRDQVRLSPEVRLHYLRCIRKNLAATEDTVAGLDDEPAPCVAEAFGDIHYDIHRSALEIDK